MHKGASKNLTPQTLQTGPRGREASSAGPAQGRAGIRTPRTRSPDGPQADPAETHALSRVQAPPGPEKASDNPR